jgi:hypothetical protein
VLHDGGVTVHLTLNPHTFDGVKGELSDITITFVRNDPFNLPPASDITVGPHAWAILQPKAFTGYSLAIMQDERSQSVEFPATAQNPAGITNPLPTLTAGPWTCVASR